MTKEEALKLVDGDVFTYETTTKNGKENKELVFIKIDNSGFYPSLVGREKGGTGTFNVPLQYAVSVKKDIGIDESIEVGVTNVESTLVVDIEEDVEEISEDAKRIIEELAAKGIQVDEDLFSTEEENDDVTSNRSFVSSVKQSTKPKEEIIKPSNTGEQIKDFDFGTFKIRIVRCDSINSETAGVKSLPTKSVDVVMTDPPYGMSFQSNTRKKENRHKKIINDDNLDWLSDWLRGINRVTKDDSFIYIFFSHHYLDTLIKYVKMYFGDGYKGILVWEKENTTAGDLDTWGSQTEFIIFIKKGNKALTEVRDGNVLKFNKVISDRHPTEKPLDLIQYILHNSCKAGELVLDSFGGSGVTAHACYNEGLSCISMEFDVEYFNVEIERIEDAVKNPKLLQAFSEGVTSRTDKYIKAMQASHDVALRDAQKTLKESLLDIVRRRIIEEPYATVTLLKLLLEIEAL